jgi:hypothetical protein
MRTIMWLFILPALCSQAALAAEKASVNVPFAFSTHGKVSPASQYDVILKDDRTFLTLTSRTNPADTITWITVPVGMGQHDVPLSLQFDQVGNLHELHNVRLGECQTPILDTHLDALKNRGPASSGQ